MNKKRLLIFFLIILIILLIPIIAMQFTDEVNWDSTDFIVATVLLTGVGLLFEIILTFVKTKKNRLTLGLILFVLFLLLWAELAVGIFGTPFAGS